jgi:hypothetical protein
VTTYLEALTDIGSMVNDPSLETYKDRAKDHFIRAINTLIKSGSYSENDYQGYVKLITNLALNATYDTTTLDVTLVKDIYPSPGGAEVFNVARRSLDEVAKISRNPEMAPGYEDVFWWRIGSNIYAQVASVSAINLATVTFDMAYVTGVDDDAWIDGTDLQAAANYLSLEIVRDAIGVATQTLIAELAGE